MYIRDRMRTRSLSGASLTVKKWQLKSLSSQLMREQNVFEETMKELRKRFATIGWSDKDFQASTVILIRQWATHQCGTNQSCACVIIENVSTTAAIHIISGLLSIHRWLKVLFTCGSSSGSLPRAQDWWIWRWLSSAGETWRTSMAEKRIVWFNPQAGGAIGPHERPWWVKACSLLGLVVFCNPVAELV